MTFTNPGPVAPAAGDPRRTAATKARHGQFIRVGAVGAAAALAVGLAACSSSGGGNPGTTPDVYTVAIMASGGGTTQPISFTLTVQ